jgi:hypothetical protein
MKDNIDELIIKQAELIAEMFEVNGHPTLARKQRKYVKKTKQEYENKRRIERENN